MFDGMSLLFGVNLCEINIDAVKERERKKPNTKTHNIS